MSKSNDLYQDALKVIPGGVNSPVRAFKAVGGKPLFIEKARGAYVYDVDGNRYIELINSWGPMILGHANQQVAQQVHAAVDNSLSFGAPTEIEVKMAELIVKMVPSIDKVRMVNSGTEATMSAIRLARGFTGKDKIIKFEGCYHGHGDAFLIAAGSGAVTMGSPDSPGVPMGVAKDTIIAGFNDIESVETLVKSAEGDIAAIILEPVAGNMGCIPPEPGFLQGLRDICDRKGIVLIFDEVMTGFRLSKGGAQELFDVRPDLTTLGKIIGGGLPVGAYGGREDIMDYVSPVGPVYQAGTLSGNPIAMNSGYVILKYLDENPQVYQKLNYTTERIVGDIKKNIEKLGLKYTVNSLGSMFSLFFTDQKVVDFSTAKTSDTSMFGKYFNEMLARGIYLAPSQYEALFVSSALEDQHVEQIVEANFNSLEQIHS